MQRRQSWTALLRSASAGPLGVIAVLARRLSAEEATAIADDFLDHGFPVSDIEISTAILALIDRPPTPAEVQRVRQRNTVNDAAVARRFERPIPRSGPVSAKLKAV
ncbi:DUF3349 domain-containing protein [Mycobacterium sp. C31M]